MGNSEGAGLAHDTREELPGVSTYAEAQQCREEEACARPGELAAYGKGHRHGPGAGASGMAEETQ